MREQIALFDSGIGGLTVLKKLMDLMPYEDYLYLADQQFFPYGTKNFEQLEHRIEIITKFLLTQNIKMIVVACNTASLHVGLIKRLCNFPVVGVIEPTVNKAISLSKNKRVCVLATQATIDSGVYQQLFSRANVECVPLACGDFVQLAEHQNATKQEKFYIVSQKLQFLKNDKFDTLILGCTHFGLLQEQISEVIGKINYVDCGTPTSRYALDLLKRGSLQSDSKQPGSVTIFTTGNLDCFNEQCKVFEMRDCLVHSLTL